MVIENPEYEVFISYKHTDKKGNITKDAEIAETLYKFLKDCGIKTFFSSTEIYDSDYNKAIFTALDQAKILFIVGAKKEYLEAKWIKKEHDTFFVTKTNPQVFCIYSGEVKLPTYLNTIQMFNFNSPDFYSKIISICQKNELEINTIVNPKQHKKKSPKFFNLKKTVLILSVVLLVIVTINYLVTNTEKSTKDFVVEVYNDSSLTVEGALILIHSDSIISTPLYKNKAIFKNIPTSFFTDSIDITYKGDSLFVLEQNKIVLKESNKIKINKIPVSIDKQVGEKNISELGSSSGALNHAKEKSSKPFTKKKNIYSEPTCNLEGVSFESPKSFEDKLSFTSLLHKNEISFYCKIGVYEFSGSMIIDGNSLVINNSEISGKLHVDKSCNKIVGSILIKDVNSSKEINFINKTFNL